MSIDLFEYPELWPAQLAAVLDEYAEHDSFTDQQIDEMLAKCNAVGYTFEYGLDCTPYNLKPLTA